MEYNRRVVVTGLGALTPIGKTLDEYWNGLENGTNGCIYSKDVFEESQDELYMGCTLKDYNPEDYFDRREIRKLDKFAQYALITSKEAMQDSGIVESEFFDTERMGVVWGTGIGGLVTIEQEIKKFYTSTNDNPRVSPFFVTKMIADIAAGHISIKYGLEGPNYVTISACSSSSNSIIDAYNLIKLNYADAMVTGGSENNSHIGYLGFQVLRAISSRSDGDLTASRPFDKDRDGFVLAEGGGALILEEYEHANKRGAKIYAEIKGVGMSADAYHITQPHPEGRGLKLVMKNALKDANLKPENIDYINAHGTSTPLGDLPEIKAIESVFGDHARGNMSISSTKSMTGHLLGASGAVESIACILSIKNQVVPPTINLFERDPEISEEIDLVPNKSKKRTVINAMSNNFGFGGHNCAIIFGKPE